MPTPILGLPYPAMSDTAQVPRDIKALADAIDPIGTVPVGGLMLWPTALPPTAWLICDGHAVLATDYPKLAAVLGSQGGQITLPDLRDRFPMGAGGTPVLGAGGANTVRLTSAQSGLPAHAHGGTTQAADRSLNHQHSFTTAVAGGHNHPLQHGSQFYRVAASGDVSNWALGTNAIAGSASPRVINNGSFVITNEIAAGDHQHAGATDAAQGGVDHLHAINAETARDATTDHENRPQFVAVNFIIRAL